MTTINIKNLGIKFKLPNCLEECTVDFFVKFSKLALTDEANIIAELSGLTVDQVNDLDSGDLDDVIFEALAWWWNVDKINTLAVPKYIEIKGLTYRVPTDLRTKTLGQKLEVKSLISEIDADDRTTFFDIIKPCFAVLIAS